MTGPPAAAYRETVRAFMPDVWGTDLDSRAALLGLRDRATLAREAASEPAAMLLGVVIITAGEAFGPMTTAQLDEARALCGFLAVLARRFDALYPPTAEAPANGI